MKFKLSKRVNVQLLLALALFSGTGASQANLIVNGDFEDTSQWSAWFFDASAAGGSSAAASNGFGIRDAHTAQAVGAAADAVVIGTRIIQLIGGQPRDQVIPLARQFLGEIRAALDALPAATAEHTGSQ